MTPFWKRKDEKVRIQQAVPSLFSSIGREAIDLMIRDIESGDGKRSVKKLVFRSTLVERESS